MTFLSLAAFLAVPLLPAIVVMYMLKLKRQRHTVPSTLLWRRSVQDMIANAPFQKLRNNLLMYLQLLLLALLILALARPLIRSANLDGSTLVLLVDQSASMQTVDEGGKSRMEVARERALEAIDGLGSRDQAIIVGFSNRTQIVQTLTGDKGLLRNAISTLRSSDTEVDLRETALILESLTTTVDSENIRKVKERVKTLLISDGGLGDAAERLADIGTVEFVRVGRQKANLGITAVDVRESFGEVLENQVFASVYNSNDVEETAFVELQLDGAVLDIKELRVPPNGSAGTAFTLDESRKGIARVVLDKQEDPFALDNEAHALVSPPTEVTILLVSQGNFFLERALTADPRTRVKTVLPTDFEALREEYDLTIFDNCTTGEALGAGTFLFINSFPASLGFGEAKDGLQNPSIVDWNRVHPIMRYVNMDRVLIGEAKRITLPKGALPLVESNDATIIGLLETETRRVAVISFDVFKSYWPVDVSFPIFMANLVDYAKRQGEAGQRSSYATGTTIPVLLPRGATTAKVITPSSREVPLDFSGATVAYLTDTNEAGVYQLRFDSGAVKNLAVNLFSELETNIAPVEALSIGGQEVAGNAGPVKSQREIWHWLVLAAFALLFLEWFIYCRRSWL